MAGIASSDQIAARAQRTSSCPDLAQPDLVQHLARDGFCFVPGVRMREYFRRGQLGDLRDWEAFAASWNDLPRDEYMADGGRYRFRRHATLSAGPNGAPARLEAHQPHYQSLLYNRLNGGIPRHFAPIAQDIAQGPTLSGVLALCGDVFGQLRPEAPWHIEVHQFRIEAAPGLAGKPTPEGVHRDGVDFVLVMMVQRVNIASGTTTIHEPGGRQLDSFTLTDPLDAALLDDHRCLHGVTPVLQLDPAQPAYRDVLVVTFRAK